MLLAALPLCAADAPTDERIQREIARLVKISDGVVGVTATHIESKETIAKNARERFPMASTFKVRSPCNCLREWIAAS